MNHSKELKKFKNRNASFEISEKYVLKNYHNKVKNLREFKQLKEMGELFSPIKHKRWQYDLVEVFRASEDKGILMSHVPGFPILESKIINKKHYYHAGFWLGHFHKSSEKNNRVKTFGDYGFQNIFIEPQKKIITAMDPSSKAMRYENFFYDIITFFKIIFLNKRRHKIPYYKSHIKQFMKGYTDAKGSVFLFSDDLYSESLQTALKEIKVSFLNKHPKLKAYLSYFVIKFHLKYRVRRVLKNLDQF